MKNEEGIRTIWISYDSARSQKKFVVQIQVFYRSVPKPYRVEWTPSAMRVREEVRGILNVFFPKRSETLPGGIYRENSRKLVISRKNNATFDLFVYVRLQPKTPCPPSKLLKWTCGNLQMPPNSGKNSTIGIFCRTFFYRKKCRQNQIMTVLLRYH